MLLDQFHGIASITPPLEIIDWFFKNGELNFLVVSISK